MRIRNLRGLTVSSASFIVATGLGLGLTPASAQQVPSWKPKEICAKDSARGQCLLLERKARNHATASWQMMPVAVRRLCSQRINDAATPSWRVLIDCVEDEGRKAWRARAAAKRKREEAALAALQSRNQQAQPNGETESARINSERDSFLALLAEQRKADSAASANRKAAAKQRRQDARKERRVTARRANAAEQRRIANEEASFMRRLEAERKADARRKAAAKKRAAARAAAIESRRVAQEEASFMRRLASQRKADKEAAARKAAAKAAAARRAAAAENRRVEQEEASFMRMLAAQRKADSLAAALRADAKKLARKKAASSCEARLEQVSAAGTIQFALNSAELSDSAGAALLDKLAAAVGNCEGKLSIVVEGHTDSIGSVSFNNRLSQARAETVAAYLRNKGIASDRISAKGLGPSKPIASNNTRAGRARNRRIEFKVQ